MEDMLKGLADGSCVEYPRLGIPYCIAQLLAYAFKFSPYSPLTLSRVKAMSLSSCYGTRKIESKLGWKLTVLVQEVVRRFYQDMFQ